VPSRGPRSRENTSCAYKQYIVVGSFGLDDDDDDDDDDVA